MSTAPKELREVDMTAKMSKSKKKKLKKRAKRNQALMEETMQHIVEKEQQEMLQENQDPANSSIDEGKEAPLPAEANSASNGGPEDAADEGGAAESAKVNGQNGNGQKKADEDEEEGGFVEEGADVAKVDGKSYVDAWTYCRGAYNYLL